MAEQQPMRVRGTLTVTDPTEHELTDLFSWFIRSPSEHNAAAAAGAVMRTVGTSVSHQFGPELVVTTEEGQKTVKVNWDRP